MLAQTPRIRSTEDAAAIAAQYHSHFETLLDREEQLAHELEDVRKQMMELDQSHMEPIERYAFQQLKGRPGAIDCGAVVILAKGTGADRQQLQAGAPALEVTVQAKA